MACTLTQSVPVSLCLGWTEAWFLAKEMGRDTPFLDTDVQGFNLTRVTCGLCPHKEKKRDQRPAHATPTPERGVQRASVGTRAPCIDSFYTRRRFQKALEAGAEEHTDHSLLSHHIIISTVALHAHSPGCWSPCPMRGHCRSPCPTRGHRVLCLTSLHMPLLQDL